MSKKDIAAATVRVIVAFVRNNAVAADQIPELIGSVRRTLGDLERPAPIQKPLRATPKQVSNSIGADFITSFENGRKYRSMKRHLKALGLSPEAYRAKWGLPVDYPMVAPSYAARRSILAKRVGLGRVGRSLPRATEDVAAEG